MKYTVIIRQPVPDNVRTKLENQLVERFGLNEQQAQRLAARRAGRLMKPTSQARAELLLKVFQGVGAQVALEEVREDSDAPSQGFRTVGALSSETESDDVELAPPLHNNATMLDFIPPSSIFTQPPTFTQSQGQPLTSKEDPFGLATGLGAFDPFSEFAQKSPGELINPADLLPDWAKQAPQSPAELQPGAKAPEGKIPELTPQVSLLSTPPQQVQPPTQVQPPPVSSAPAPQEVITAKTDDWADFAGGLNLPETNALPETPRQNTEFLTAVTEASPAKSGPRTSLSQQIRLGTLLPLGLSSLLTLLLLGLVIPRLQQQLVQTNAKTLASTIAIGLNTANQSAADTQLDAIVRQPNVGFVRVELPSGSSYVRSKTAANNDSFNKELSSWAKTNIEGSFDLGGQRYVLERVSLGQDGNVISPSSAGQGAASSPVVRQVTVGVPNSAVTDIVRNTLLLVLLATLIGLAIASFLAARAAQRIVQPLSELVKVADAISLGDLTRPVKAARNDEIGDLTLALERMRLSLEAAMDRLRRRKRS